MHRDDRDNLVSSDFKLSQLSSADREASRAIAVFAYNEAETIEQALDSVAATTGHEELAIYVLANGCTDSTVARVRRCAGKIDNLWLVETDAADKAGTWNLFVHDLLSAEQMAKIDTCFFMDGDVTLAPDTLSLLASALDTIPSAEASGAMPATGRDKEGWRRRMTVNAMLAGNCYALRGRFVRYIRERQVRMPVGLIGEDFFVSWLVASNVWRDRPPDVPGARCVFHNEAEFSFRSLSPWRLSDYRTYLRRKWRYSQREIQHQMLVLLLMEKGMQALPRDVNELYRTGPLPSRSVWRGLDTPLRLIALQQARRQQVAAPAKD